MGHLNGFLAPIGGREIEQDNLQKFKCPGVCPGGMLNFRIDRRIIHKIKPLHSRSHWHTSKKTLKRTRLCAIYSSSAAHCTFIYLQGRKRCTFISIFNCGFFFGGGRGGWDTKLCNSSHVSVLYFTLMGESFAFIAMR